MPVKRVGVVMLVLVEGELGGRWKGEKVVASALGLGAIWGDGGKDHPSETH